MNLHLKTAKWQTAEGSNIRCLLCPRQCLIPDSAIGFCAVRKNISGVLYSLAYGNPVALQVDPIEKKPLYEFLPHSKTFSIGTFGCNLSCIFCQNHHLSRGHYSKKTENDFPPERIVKLALDHKCQSIAFTYNEPLIWGEYIIDIAKLAKSHNLATVLVSNAYISEEAANDIFPYIDAANFDMKGFSEEFYKQMTGGDLATVLKTIENFYLRKSHLELTNLIIPGKNDSLKMIDDYLKWVNNTLDNSIPLHFSAYHPDYKYSDSPPTLPQTLFNIQKHAEAKGFKVYLGNIGSYK